MLNDAIFHKLKNPPRNESVLLRGPFVLTTKIACMKLLLKINRIFS